MMYKPLITLIFLMALCYKEAFCQVKYSGREFYISLAGQPGPAVNPPATQTFNYNGDSNSVQLASKKLANVTFYYTNTGQIVNYTVTPESVVLVRLDTAQRRAVTCRQLEQVENRSLRITSDADINVGLTTGIGSITDDATLVLPVDGQKKADTYYLLGKPKTGVGYSGYVIISACDSTKLRISPSRPTAYNYLPFNITLNRGETYYITTPINKPVPVTNGDIAGTKVEILSSPCCFPLTIYNNQVGEYISWPLTSSGQCCADLLLEQLLPVNLWDTLYPVVAFYDKMYNIVRVISSANNNAVYYNDKHVSTLNAGQVFDTLVYADAPVLIRSDYPVAVGQLMISNHNDDNTPYYKMHNGDPDLLWSYPLKYGIKESYFRPYNRFPNTTKLFILTIISRKDNINSVRLNGKFLGKKFDPFPLNPEWQYAHILLKQDEKYYLQSAGPVIAYQLEEENDGSYTTALSDSRLLGGTVHFSDTLYKCNQDSFELTALYADTYSWSTGATTQSIIVSVPGFYSVTSSTGDACMNMSTQQDFYIIEMKNKEPVSDTIVKCLGTVMNITADSPADYYKWSTGYETRSINTDTPGLYIVNAFTDSPCLITQQHVFNISDKSYEGFEFGADTTLCTGEKLLLKTGYEHTIWSTGETGKGITIINDGIYYATVTDSCNVIHSDTIVVKTGACLEKYCTITFPSAFTPNGDGKNDVFKAISHGQFDKYEFALYNRFGERVYNSNDINTGWDGMYKNEKAEIGVYFYYCITTCPLKGKVLIKGDVMLVR
jgi:gliding motility-associated-like protein